MKKHGNSADTVTAAKASIFTETVRKYKNKFFQPVRIGYGSNISRSFEEPASYLIDHIKTTGPHSHRPYDNDAFKPGISVVKSDDFKDRLKLFKNVLKHFIVCNGILWVESGEPMYTYYTFGMGNNHVSTDFAISYDMSASQRKKHWPAEKRAEAIQAAIDAATKRGDTLSIKGLKNPKQMIKRIYHVKIKK